jgi:hypothetical protein
MVIGLDLGHDNFYAVSAQVSLLALVVIGIEARFFRRLRKMASKETKQVQRRVDQGLGVFAYTFVFAPVISLAVLGGLIADVPFLRWLIGVLVGLQVIMTVTLVRAWKLP